MNVRKLGLGLIALYVMMLLPGLIIAQSPETTPDQTLKPTPIPELAPGVKGPVDVEPPLNPDPKDAPDLSSKALLNISLNVSRYDQTDYDDEMETCDETIDDAGCALTSAAMAFKYYGATNKAPDQLNTCMGDDACPFVWTAGPSCSEGEATYIGYYNFSYSTMVWALEDSRPPILKLENGSDVHWVVVYSVYGDGLSADDYRINDPYGGSSKNLSSYTNNGWSLEKIVIYGSS